MGELEALKRRVKETPGLLGARRSYAVLCPVVEREDGAHLLFEVRAAGVRQGGDVCFPGGAMEPGETPETCALRETEEELGIDSRQVELLGQLPFICSQRGFLLHPVLGRVRPEALENLRPAAAEVAEAFTVPLSFFRETAPEVWTYPLTPQVPEDFPYEAYGISRDYPWAAGRIEVPLWRYEGHTIWGMTGRITRYLTEK